MIYAVLLAVAIISPLIVYFRFPGIIIEVKKRCARRNAGLSRHVVQVDEFQWAYLTGGEGEVVLLVHGFGGDKDRWVPFLSQFDGKRYQVFAPDLPGFGENVRFNTVSYDIPSQVERLHRFVQALGINSVHLLGVSMGGCLAGCYASKYPDQVRSLSLMDSAGVHPPVPSDMAVFQQEVERNILIVKSREQFVELNTFMYYNPPQVPAPFTDWFARQAVSAADFHLKIFADLQKNGGALLEECLPDIAAPTLVIWGAQDRVFHVSCADVFEQGIKDCRTVIIDQCGHLPYLEKPEEAREVYWLFVENIA